MIEVATLIGIVAGAGIFLALRARRKVRRAKPEQAHCDCGGRCGAKCACEALRDASDHV